MIMKIRSTIVEFIKLVVFRYTNLGAPRYIYNIEPIQLSALIFEIDRLKDKKGNIVEIGVARGLTTLFMSQHILNEGLQDNLSIYAIDTFNSFTNSDLEYEVQERGKSLDELEAFNYNDFDVWKSNFKQYNFVKPIQEDCSEVDYQEISPIKISFLDVDLYLPTKKALKKIYQATIEGGVIFVDDVRENNNYDGAYQAYMEFCNEMDISPKIIGNKCGVIYK